MICHAHTTTQCQLTTLLNGMYLRYFELWRIFLNLNFEAAINVIQIKNHQGVMLHHQMSMGQDL